MIFVIIFNARRANRSIKRNQWPNFWDNDRMCSRNVRIKSYFFIEVYFVSIFLLELRRLINNLDRIEIIAKRSVLFYKWVIQPRVKFEAS